MKFLSFYEIIQELLYDPGYQTKLVFMHNDAPPHFLLEVRTFLNNAFANRWGEVKSSHGHHDLLISIH